MPWFPIIPSYFPHYSQFLFPSFPVFPVPFPIIPSSFSHHSQYLFPFPRSSPSVPWFPVFPPWIFPSFPTIPSSFSHHSQFLFPLFSVQAVRAVVPNRSNTEIVLVLQHFDNAVDRTVQAFMEGKKSRIWEKMGKFGKKWEFWGGTGWCRHSWRPKKKKSKPRPQPGPGPAPSAPEPWPGPALNGFHGNGADTMETLSDGGDSGGGLWDTGGAWGNCGKFWGIVGYWGSPGDSGKLEESGGFWEILGDCGKLGEWCSLEKSLKDLQRCSVALARFRALLRDEVENSLRRARAAFGEIQSCLMDREVALLAEMDKVKAEAMELLSLRQRRAEALRLLTEAAPGMSEEQLLELRADIKHFVSERKFDEELGRAGRFGCDLEALRGSIGNFGHEKSRKIQKNQPWAGPGASAATWRRSGAALGPLDMVSERFQKILGILGITSWGKFQKNPEKSRKNQPWAGQGASAATWRRSGAALATLDMVSERFQKILGILRIKSWKIWELNPGKSGVKCWEIWENSRKISPGQGRALRLRPGGAQGQHWQLWAW
uniref:Uncharacterized protein n=1 Tax=Catharus ustulatus TaxID=91951 RepID=A0A8C3U7I2_CATUS